MSALAGKWERRTLQSGPERRSFPLRPTSPVKTTPPRLSMMTNLKGGENLRVSVFRTKRAISEIKPLTMA
jgi:hypothetical protein